jgi:hypothetical protein
MSAKFSNTGIEDPLLEFDGGVAAIDIMTLNRAARAVAALGFEPQLPTVADVAMPPVFDSLCVIEVEPGLHVRVTIDTKKMTWALDSDEVHRHDFTDYTGKDRYGVLVNGRPLAAVNGIATTNVPAKLVDGRPLMMWFAEVPRRTLDETGYYGLFSLAKSLADGFTDWREFDDVVIPAQQIKWERRMNELLPANPALIGGVTQRVWVALDESGVRVKAATMIYTGGVAGQPVIKRHTFGADHPVVMWLTEPGSTIPFAVVATTADTWLDPGRAASFEESAFSD